MKKVFIAAAAVIILLFLASCAAFPQGEESQGPSATFTPEPTGTPVPEATPVPVAEATPRAEAKEITDQLNLSDNYGGYFPYLLDGDPETWIAYKWNTEIYIESKEPISFLYICWYRQPKPYTVRLSGGSFMAGESEYLYEYVEMPFPTNHVELSFSTTENLSDIHAYGVGAVPDNVQRWEPALEKADVLVFPTHADDETVFFGGVIADCVDRGLDVQICYMVEHYDHWYTWHTRPQELLNAIWELGIRHYPVIGPFQDHFITSWDDAEEHYGIYNVIGYQVEQIRRFQPLVVLGHDRYGEYGHAAHMMNGQALERAVVRAADARQYPRSAQTWGVWDTPKLYLHFADENRIVLDLEKPLEHFGGRTAFEVANDAMQFHKSQLRYEHRPQLDNEDFPRYDCRIFGLVRSTVGEDTGNDIMEHTSRD